MNNSSLLPKHEDLRRAFEWLAEQKVRDMCAVQEAARLFDLSPIDEQFLNDYCLQQNTNSAQEGQ